MSIAAIGHLKPRVREYLLIILTLGLFVGFGLHHLTKFVTADEHYWLYERIPQYWDALENEKWKKTFINDKPGVSVALISGIGLLFEPEPKTLCSRTPEQIFTCDTSRTEGLLLAFRLPILLISTVMIGYLFWIIRKISSVSVATWSVLFIGLSPKIIGMSQIVNPDALLWSFGAAAVFSYLAVLKYAKWKYIALSGVFLGLAVLSKYTAGILVPFFLMLSVFSPRTYSMVPGNEQIKAARGALLRFLAVISISIATIALFLPAVWSEPIILQTLLSGGSDKPLIFLPALTFVLFLSDNVFLKGKVFSLLQMGINYILSCRYLRTIMPWGIALLFLTLIAGRIAIPDWDLFERIPFDLKDITSDTRIYGPTPTLTESVLLETNPFVFSLTPIMILFLLVSLFRAPFRHSKDRFLNFSASMIILFFPIYISVLISMGVLATPRYLIMLYPLVAFLAAIGVQGTSDLIKKSRWLPPKIHRLRHGLLTIVIIIPSLGSLFLSQPFPFNYTNGLLPRNNLISDAWGYGGYEAAQYLNSLPDAEKILVWSDYEGLCEFFKGKCLVKQYKYSGKQSIDYAFITRRGEILYNPDHSRWLNKGNIYMKPAYDDPAPAWRLDIGGRPDNFAKIIKIDKELRVGIVTDIAACENDPGNYEHRESRLPSLVKSLDQEQTSFNVSLGDNVNYGLRRCNESGERDLGWVREHLETRSPFHYVLGDHDIMSNKSTDAFWRTFTEQKQTYYSFDAKDVHVIILDTILGGDRMRESCSDDPVCSDYGRSKDTLSSLLKNPTALHDHLVKNDLTRMDIIIQRDEYSRLFEEENQKIKYVRSPERRDRGRIGAHQLSWLKEDLHSTDKTKVLIFSGHPLFRFQSPNKLYDIEDRESVQKILRESEKDVVSIAGEAHTWHDETIDGVHYYIVDEFIRGNGAWAVFRWNEEHYKLLRYIDGRKVSADE